VFSALEIYDKFDALRCYQQKSNIEFAAVPLCQILSKIKQAYDVLCAK